MTDIGRNKQIAKVTTGFLAGPIVSFYWPKRAVCCALLMKGLSDFA